MVNNETKIDVEQFDSVAVDVDFKLGNDIADKAGK